MSLVAKASGSSSFAPVPPGMHLARCYRIIDLGTQQTEFKGVIKHLPKVMFQWEVHGEDENGNPTVTNKNEPMSISKNYTLSLGDKAALRKDLETWRAKSFAPEELRGFDLKTVLGAWCMLSVVETTGNDGKRYTNVGAIMPVPTNVKKSGLPEPHNKSGIFTIENPDMTLFETFSDYLKEKIKSAPEWVDSGTSSGSEAVIDDEDVPF